jgi:hypothetical protein
MKDPNVDSDMYISVILYLIGAILGIVYTSWILLTLSAPTFIWVCYIVCISSMFLAGILLKKT